MNRSLLIAGFAAFATASAQQPEIVQYAKSATESYSQKTLLKNWALSVCLARIASDPTGRSDANATASAYMEFGQQPIEAYDALRVLAEKFAARKYGGSVASEFNTMKCIDLLYSIELDSIATELAKEK